MSTTPSRIITGRITAAERMQNTPSGNPRYMLTVEGAAGVIERIPTRADAAWVYTIGPADLTGALYRVMVDDGSVIFAGHLPSRVESGPPLV